jgi:hypothetical protein
MAGVSFSSLLFLGEGPFARGGHASLAPYFFFRVAFFAAFLGAAAFFATAFFAAFFFGAAFFTAFLAAFFLATLRPPN